MKVVIIGGFKRQIDLAARGFDNLDIRLANKEAKHGTGEDQLYAQADRLIVLTKFVSHGLTGKLDRSKTTWINGGMSQLRSTLQTLNTTARLEAPTTARIITPAEQEEEEEMAAFKFDFSPLAHSKVGDVHRFKRPANMTIADFDLKVMQGRSYYKRIYGVVTEFTRGDGYIDVLVTELNGKPSQEAAAVAVAHAAQKQDSGSLGPSLPLIPAETEADYRTLEAPRSTVDRVFWQHVFLKAMELSPGSPGSWASDANDAFDAMTKKCGNI